MQTLDCSAATRMPLPEAARARGCCSLPGAHGTGTASAPVASPGPGAPRRPANSTGMVRIGGTRFRMGDERDEGFPEDGEGPVRVVSLSPFWMDAMAVTNRDFAAFVAQTGHVSEAERIGWSFVFHMLLAPQAQGAVRDTRVPDAPWWLAVDGACWHSPEGPGSGVTGRESHPVVHVSWHDAAAYAAWAGKRLPGEAEWEMAARGGIEGARYPWGDEFVPDSRHRCNTWQGRFPHINTGADGYIGTCPVDAFDANGYGLYNMAGNVWEWCADWWSADWHVPAGASTRVNPAGPAVGESRVIRGGSYLCHASYCNRYRTSARSHNRPDSSTGHMGFRCAADTVAAQPP